MYLDIVILAVLVVSLLFGLKNGFFVEFISTFGVIINFVITQKITPIVLTYVEEYIGTNYTFTYIVLFIVIFIAFSVLIHILNITLKRQRVFIVSRICGGILSLVKGIIISGLILLIFNVTAERFTRIGSYGENSKVNAYFLEFSEDIDKYIPEVFKEKLKQIRDNKTIDKYIDKLF